LGQHKLCLVATFDLKVADTTDSFNLKLRLTVAKPDISQIPTTYYPSPLINTPLQRGDEGQGGFQTVSTVWTVCEKPLKRFSSAAQPAHPAEAGC